MRQKRHDQSILGRGADIGARVPASAAPPPVRPWRSPAGLPFLMRMARTSGYTDPARYSHPERQPGLTPRR
ncbi:hypothetical protein FM112_16375 [Gulosibacter sp. 10]|nr:hypothetical protein FM112_16375 [Gulosibacter sp. 10]